MVNPNGHESQVVLAEQGVQLKRLEQIGRRLARALRPGDLVLLYGPLGAGKTTLVRAVAREFRTTDQVRSPSFTIANIYAASTTIQHLDLYRLEEIGEDDALALEEYVKRLLREQLRRKRGTGFLGLTHDELEQMRVDE